MDTCVGIFAISKYVAKAPLGTLQWINMHYVLRLVRANRQATRSIGFLVYREKISDVRSQASGSAQPAL